MKNIIINKAKCKRCGDILISEHRYDFKQCKCKAISVDGGNDYIRRVGKLEYVEELSEFEEEVLDEKLEIMIDIISTILDFEREVSLSMIKSTEIYASLVQEDFRTSYGSPQENVEDIGRELVSKGHKIGQFLTADNIRKAMLCMMKTEAE